MHLTLRVTDSSLFAGAAEPQASLQEEETVQQPEQSGIKRLLWAEDSRTAKVHSPHPSLLYIWARRVMNTVLLFRTTASPLLFFLVGGEEVCSL